MKETVLVIDNQRVTITHPDKVLWPERGLTKRDYIHYLIQVAPYMLPYLKNRLLMMWCYPDGIDKKGFARRVRPAFAPAYVVRREYEQKDRICINDLPTLVWVGQTCALELHVPFVRVGAMEVPLEIAFDLDPSVPDDFSTVCDIGVRLRSLLDSLGLMSVPKTSGASGLHVFLPVQPRYTFEQLRRFTKFVAEYMAEAMPRQITLDRAVDRRGTKLYFDYLQLWRGRTLSAPYSVRATPQATVSTPVTWAEIERGVSPRDFTVETLPRRLQHVGDLFACITTEKVEHAQRLDEILQFLDSHRR